MQKYRGKATYLDELILAHAVDESILPVVERPANSVPTNNSGDVLRDYVVHKTYGEPKHYELLSIAGYIKRWLPEQYHLPQMADKVGERA